MNTPGNTKIKYIGHSTFLIELESKKKMIIDPWLNDNPSTNETPDSIGEVDFVLITHGHFDHVGDSIEILKKNKSAIAISNFEIGQWLGKKGLENLSPMSHGGSQYFDDFTVTMVNAIHGSGISDTESENLVYGGIASGLVIKLSNNFCIYHAGDTSVFGDMEIISELYKPDLCMIPIGDHFTMGVDEALYATKLLKVNDYIPIHYGTFPVLTGNPQQFKEKVESSCDSKVHILKPGDEYK